MQKNKAREPNHAPSISFLRSSKHPVPERRRKKKSKPNSMCHVRLPRNALPAKPIKSARAAFFRFRSRNQTMGSSDATRKNTRKIYPRTNNIVYI